jgi:hypothetical protein
MPKLEPVYILTFLIALALHSCDRIKRKSKQVANNTKATLAEKKAEFGDKLIAHYDSYKPDTKFNKRRFQEFFSFAPPADVKDIYCHADEMGIDHDYQFSFYCNSATVNKIVQNLQLTKADSSDNFSNGLWHSFPWWDSTRIVTLTPYLKKGDHETYWYLWYDQNNEKAYYFEFDM